MAAAPDNKPAIVFVPSRKQSQLTAIDMVTYAAADGEPNRFLTVQEEEIAPVVETVREPALQQTLGHGVGFVHLGMLEADRKRVEGLYRDGIIKVGVGVVGDACARRRRRRFFLGGGGSGLLLSSFAYFTLIV